MLTIQETKDLVKAKIQGYRKGTEQLTEPIPNYLHSFRVYEALKSYGFDENTQMAGLLHDIIEDGAMTSEALKDLGYPDAILHLVDLATHDLTIDGSFEKRKKMMKRLIEEDDKDAWAIKLADISDNLLECHLMPEKQKLERFLNKKCPVFVYYGNKYFGGTEFYNEFLERYFTQVKAYNEYFMDVSEYPDIPQMKEKTPLEIETLNVAKDAQNLITLHKVNPKLADEVAKKFGYKDFEEAKTVIDKM